MSVGTPRAAAVARAVVVGLPRVPPSWTLSTDVVTGQRAMVVSGHPLASAVGVDVLRRGGNAADAAVAVAFALAVVLPEAGNLGGGGFLVLSHADGTVRALDFRETAPARATPDMFIDSAGSASGATSYLESGVPGTVAGLAELHRREGRLAWATLVAPAVRLAAEGHVVDSIRSEIISQHADRLRQHPTSRVQFLIHDRAPPPGTLWRQPELAGTLRSIAQLGPDAFYRGAVAELIVREMERGGGLISRDDLEAYRAVWREPLALRYRGYTLYTMPPPSAGGIALGIMLNIMEGFDTLPPLGSARLLHLEAEAMRRAYAVRNTFVGDPTFVDVPVSRLVSKRFAAALRAEIVPGRVGPVVIPPAPTEGRETIHIAVVDGEGNAVSATTTINDLFGSGVTVTDGGFLLNDEMKDFTTDPRRVTRSPLSGLGRGGANLIAPGKRMVSSMTPTIVFDPAGDLMTIAGARGGTRITTSVYHVLVNVIDHGLTLPAALAAPRVHHQLTPDSLEVERGGFDAAVLDSLAMWGHLTYVSPTIAKVNAIARTPDGWTGAGDPRGGSAAAGW